MLELIQNADDNTYDGVCPTLRFTYRPGSLRIDCNEIGFTAENVEAICAISQSTKSGKTGHGEFIGEKGIGFKSVFKAAYVVWISSNDFTLKFDKTKSLGMVTPPLDPEPQPTKALKGSENEEEPSMVNEKVGETLAQSQSLQPAQIFRRGMNPQRELPQHLDQQHQ